MVPGYPVSAPIYRSLAEVPARSSIAENRYRLYLLYGLFLPCEYIPTHRHIRLPREVREWNPLHICDLPPPNEAYVTQKCSELMLKERYHDNVCKFRLVVTSLPSREIRDVTNGGVRLRSEMAKHCSRCSVVKLMSAYLTLEAHWWYPPFKRRKTSQNLENWLLTKNHMEITLSSIFS